MSEVRVRDDRETWMDLVRGFAIVMVISHHSLYLTTLFLGATPEPLGWLDRFWEPFRMPTLVFLSGMLLAKSLCKPPRRFARNKARNLAWPYWLWSLIFLAMTTGINPGALLHVLLAPPTYLWYLWYLFAYYLAALALNRLNLPAGVALGLSLLTSAVITERYGLAKFFYLFTFFLLGHLMAVHQARLRSMLARKWMAMSLFVLALATALVSAFDVSVKFQTEWIVGVIAAAALAVRVGPAVPSTAVAGWVEWVGKRSIVFYLAHWIAMWVVSATLVSVRVQTSAVFIVCNFVIGLLAGWAFAAARERWKFFGPLFVWPERRIWHGTGKVSPRSPL